MNNNVTIHQVVRESKLETEMHNLAIRINERKRNIRECLLEISEERNESERMSVLKDNVAMLEVLVMRAREVQYELEGINKALVLGV